MKISYGHQLYLECDVGTISSDDYQGLEVEWRRNDITVAARVAANFDTLTYLGLWKSGTLYIDIDIILGIYFKSKPI